MVGVAVSVGGTGVHVDVGVDVAVAVREGVAVAACVEVAVAVSVSVGVDVDALANPNFPTIFLPKKSTIKAITKIAKYLISKRGCIDFRLRNSVLSIFPDFFRCLTGVFSSSAGWACVFVTRGRI